MITSLPKVIRVEEFAQSFGLSMHQGYEAIKQMPNGIVIRLGRRIRLNADALAAWLSAGGSVADRAS